MEKSELLKLINVEMSRKDFAQSTKKNYLAQIEDLFEFYVDRQPDNLTIEEIGQFISHLENRRGLQPQTINIANYAFAFAYNMVLKKNYDFSKLKYKRREYLSGPSIFTPDEILQLLDTIENIKHRVMITMIYSSGLTLSQLIGIKLKDIDSINLRLRVQPYSKRSKPYQTVLSETASVLIKKYLDQYHPEKFLIEGTKPGLPYRSGRQIQSVLEAAMQKAGITKNISLMDLRHSFIIHLRNLGYPVKQILEVAGSINTATFYRYATAHLKYDRELQSPLDLIKMRREQNHVDVRILRNLVDRIKDNDERNYFYEAIDCFGCGALRAGIILIWIAVMMKIQTDCLRNIDNLNAAIIRHFPKARIVDTIDDFAYIRDDVILKAAHDLGNFDKNQTAQLQECLNLRNQCAHPGNYTPGIQKVQSFVEVIIQIVYL